MFYGYLLIYKKSRRLRYNAFEFHHIRLHSLWNTMQKYEENPKQQKVSCRIFAMGHLFIYSDLTASQAGLNGQSAPG